MTAYAVGHLQDVDFCDDIVDYLQRIDATLAPFGGRFVVHGAKADVVEGEWRGDLIVIAFDDMSLARGWYDSAAYRQILSLRTKHARSAVFLIEGVDATHRATDILQAAR